MELDTEGGPSGPLWSTIKRQLYPSEVHHVKRLVGLDLIKENRTMWDELGSLQQMLAEFQRQNSELLAATPQAALAGHAPSLHRELLRQQAQVLLQDAKSQAVVSGLDLAGLVPALGKKQVQEFLSSTAAHDPSPLAGPPTPSTQPSTRPSSASGHSGCCMPEQLASMPVLSLGRQLGIDELGSVAEGVREALREEQSVLLAAISEQQRLLDAEDARRLALSGSGAAAMKHSAVGEPSTDELQQLVHALQDLAISKGPWVSGAGYARAPAQPKLAGGAQVRRIRALIEQRRCQANAMAALPEALEGAPEVVDAPGPGGACSLGGRPPLDPFFDDPFAS